MTTGIYGLYEDTVVGETNRLYRNLFYNVTTNINITGQESGYDTANNQNLTTVKDTTYYNPDTGETYRDYGWRPWALLSSEVTGVYAKRDRSGIIVTLEDDSVVLPYGEISGLTETQIESEIDTWLGRSVDIFVNESSGDYAIATDVEPSGW
jgi:hypothetical protein